MNTFFPFGYAPWTAFYLSMYVFTLIVHVIFMNYVLAGTAYMAGVSLVTGSAGQRLRQGLVATTLRDWMPFALGGAITAGVAPLLFVQVLYKKNFYTANLLQFHGWMSILPVLIVGFYLLYLIKQADRVWTRDRNLAPAAEGILAPAAAAPVGGQRSLPLRALLAVGAFTCIAYVGFGWTQNNVLSMQSQRAWSAFYESGRMVYRDPVLWPRLAIWFAGAFPTMILLVSWQLLLVQKRGVVIDQPYLQRAFVASAVSFGVAGAAVIVNLILLEGRVRTVLFGWVHWPYVILVTGGVTLMLWAWWGLRRAAALSTRGLGLASMGLVLALVGATALREILRLASVDIKALEPVHAAIARSGGLVTFLVFLLVNVVVIGWCIRMVHGSLKGAELTNERPVEASSSV